MDLVVKFSDRHMSNFHNTTTQFQIVFGKILYNVKKVKLKSVILPNVIYNVTNNNNNVFNFSVGTNNFTYFIPIGYYTINNLLNTLQTGLNAIGAAQPATFSFRLSFSYTTQLVTITCSTSCVINFSVGNSCAKLLEFSLLNTVSNTTFTGIYAPKIFERN